MDTYDGNGINVITRENYKFLRDSFFNYALLLKKEAAHTPGNSVGESIARLYDEMKGLIGDNLNVNIEQEKEGGSSSVCGKATSGEATRCIISP